MPQAHSAGIVLQCGLCAGYQYLHRVRCKRELRETACQQLATLAGNAAQHSLKICQIGLDTVDFTGCKRTGQLRQGRCSVGGVYYDFGQHGIEQRRYLYAGLDPVINAQSRRLRPADQ